MKAFLQKQFFVVIFSLLLILTLSSGILAFFMKGAGVNNVLVCMAIISLVLLVLMYRRIKNENKKQRALLMDLEENNRKYLFNSGSTYDSNKPEEVVVDSIKSLQKANAFVKKIADGNYNASWDGMNETLLLQNQESLAGELLRMREQMRKMKEEDEKRYWTNEGLAQISTLVRNHQQHLETLSDESVRFLAKYLKMQQGSLFLLNEEDKNLELSSCYAFDKKKYIVDKRINIGTGLVGQAYLEAETTILKEVPQGYTYITSGLGDATPSFIVVVPAKYNEKVEAIMEFAGFVELEDYQVKFIEKAGEFIASAILSAKTTEKMKYLLEKAQQQAEIMQSQEEEMRQNMEEMEATQEEMNRRGKEMETMQNRLQTTNALLESLLASTDDTIYFKDQESRFIRVSSSFLRLANFNSLDEVIGKSDFDFVTYEDAKPKYDAEMDVIRTGIPMNVLEKDTLKDGSIAWISTKKFPLKDTDGNTVGTFGMSRDVTALQNAMLEMERQKAHMEEELREKDRLKKELEECRGSKNQKE